ncbi:c-type cytochrome biogenesis protein CcsB [Thermodesulfobacteriota bacterium]
MQEVQTINQHLFTASMFIYLAASFFYIVYMAFRYQAVGEKSGKFGSLLVVLGVLIHTIAIVLRWIESYNLPGDVGHAPFSNMYESMVFFSWTVMLVYIIYEKKTKMKALGAFVAPLGFLGIAIVSLFGDFSPEISPLVPALQSIWLEIHVITCFIGYGAFAVAFGASIMYLIKKGQEERGGAKEGAALPPSKDLEEISYKTIAVGFPFLTAGIITGAIWANSAWGTYWSWDPKETWSLITWFMYAAFLHSRYTQGWRGRKMAWLSIIGFAFVVFTYWGVNFLLAGLHSYG